jgi:RHS repeat-associated protein
VSTLFRFTGEQHDTETGFTYLRARYANPSLGRFVSADTVQPNAPGTQGYNPYAYVAGNPTTWVDPSGHVAMEAGLALGRFVLTLQFIDPTLIVRTVNRCGANAFCLTGVGTIALSAVACALDVSGGCLLGAFEDAGVINWLGSAGYSDAAWDSWEKLKDALKKWPWLPATPLLPLLQDTIDKIDFSTPGGGGGGGGNGCPSGYVRHHVIPTQILNDYLPPDIANDPDVRGKKGAPNRWCIPESLHKQIHGQGRFNGRWIDELSKLTEMTKRDVLAIRDKLVDEFALGPYAP